MYLIAGLGNPGREYEGTPHNVGFEVAARLARRAGAEFRRSPSGKAEEALLPGRAVILRPRSYMNRSGEVVAAALRWHQIAIEQLIVVCDDVNLPPGFLRIRSKGSAGGQKGLISIIEMLGTDEFARLRIGVGGGEPGADVARYVLRKFPRELRDTMTTALDLAAEAVECWLKDGMEAAMNRYNTRRSSPEDDNPSGGDVPPDA